MGTLGRVVVVVVVAFMTLCDFFTPLGQLMISETLFRVTCPEARIGWEDLLLFAMIAEE